MFSMRTRLTIINEYFSLPNGKDFEYSKQEKIINF
jgi:hypothetical protein